MIVLADLVIPSTTASTAALELASAYQSPALQSHSHRVYLWAAAYAAEHDIAYDAELLFVAAMLHDIGLVPEFDNHTLSFEEAAAHIARAFATGAGWPPTRRNRLAEVIVRHMWPAVDVADDPEGHLISRAAALDIAGKNVDDFTPAFRAEVLAQHPRLDLVEEFLTCFKSQATRKPTSTAAQAINSNLNSRMHTNPLDTN